MSNLLEVAMIDLILSLHRRNWSQRRIAHELGINRETVARYLRQAEAASKPASAPTGSTPAEGASKPASAPTGSAALPDAPQAALAPPGSTAATAPRDPGQPSRCEPFRSVIEAKRALGLTAQRTYQDLVAEHGYTGSYYSVRRFIHRLEQTQPLPFRRLDSEPGDEAQVDFGSGAPVHTTDGHRRKTHVFRIVLSHSRKGYSEAVYRQTTDDFLRCLENAFRHFGGVPRRLVLDNLRAAVSRADWFDPELNPKVRAFAQHYGTAFLPNRPYTPRHKGKVERGIAYVRDNALKGHSFPSLEEQNRFLRDWEQTTADTRLHGTTRQHVGKHFAEVERAALLALPTEPFPSFHEERRSVHRDGHVEVEHAHYSVPPEYLARPVWVRWDGRLVRIFNERMEPLIVHVQREPGQTSTQPPHIAAAKISGVERGASWHLSRVRRLGPHCTRWAEAMLADRDVEGVRVLMGLLSLAARYPTAALDRACAIAADHGSYRLQTIRALIERDTPKQEVFSFLDEHPMIRPLSDYGQFVHNAFSGEEVPS